MSMLRLGPRDMREVESFPVVMMKLVLSSLFFDVLFYGFHRILHTKYFYKRIHKIHHEWKAPIGVIAIYAHPTGRL